MDEAGFGRINKPKRCWCRKGIRPSIPCHHVREYIYAYAAVFPATGDLTMLILPRSNTVCMNIFLEEVSREMAEKQVLLIMDRAPWHASGALAVPDNILVEYLLPYSPELNPTENLWDEIREKGFRNEAFASLERVKDKLSDTVQPLFRNKDSIRSLTFRSWLNIPDSIAN